MVNIPNFHRKKSVFLRIITDYPIREAGNAGYTLLASNIECVLSHSLVKKSWPNKIIFL